LRPESRAVLIPGDGIGPEVVNAARLVLDQTGVELEWEVHDLAPRATDSLRPGLPEELLLAIRKCGVALKGPVATVAGRLGVRSMNVALRRALDLYVQVRPCRSRPGVRSPFSGVDLVVIRDTTEDLYAGIEFEAQSPEAVALIESIERHGGMQISAESALGIKPVSERACRRLATFAFDYARRHGYQLVTVVHKATAMRYTDGLFLDVAREVAAGYNEVVCNDRQIDAVCADLVRRPREFGVLVTLNLYGDILSDLAAAVTGGLGLAPGANFGDNAAIFESAHGTAPRLAGQHRANPIAMILCGALMLRHMGDATAADLVEAAVDEVLERGEALTYDLQTPPSGEQPASTEAVAEAIASTVARRR
jgi:isocitrate dehydrogenase (NAD+)